MTANELAEWVIDARQRTFDIVADLTDEQIMSPYLAIVNPLLWEIGHVAWFQEKWVLRDTCKQKPIRDDADALWIQSQSLTKHGGTCPCLLVKEH